MTDIRSSRPPQTVAAGNTPASNTPPQNSAKVNAAHTRFVEENGIGIRLGGEQTVVLEKLLSTDGGSDLGQVYLALAYSGIGLVPGDSTASQERFEAILDTAQQVWAGQNLGSGVHGRSPLRRLDSLASTVKQMSSRGKLNNASINLIRNRMLQNSDDRFVAHGSRMPALKPGVGGGTSQALRTPGALPNGMSLEGIFAHPTPQPRTDAAQGRQTGLPVDMLPNGKSYSHAAAAAIIDTPKYALDITHGMTISDRMAVADQYAILHKLTGDDGQILSGKPAYEAMFDAVNTQLFGRDEFVFKAQFGLDNASGQVQAHDMVMLDLEGYISHNGEAIQRLLMRCDKSQLNSLDTALKGKYGLRLEDAVGKISTVFGFVGADSQRRAEFIMHAPRLNGEVSPASVQAFELREAVLGMGTDENKVFRLLEQMSGSEFLQVAGAYAQVNAALWHDKVDGKPILGDDGRSGNPLATALYGRLFDDLDDFVGGDELWLQRLGVAAQGLRFAPPADASATEITQLSAHHATKVAAYVAVSVRLAGKSKTDAADVVSLMNLVKADPTALNPRISDGKPLMNDVRQDYQIRFADRNMRLDAQKMASGEVKQLVGLTLEGDGYSSAAAGALRIHNALETGLFGVLGTAEGVLAEVLDRHDLPVEARATFVTNVAKEYKTRYGKELAKAIKESDQVSQELTLPGGNKIPSRISVLLESGSLTPAERLVYSMHEPGFMNFFGKTEGDQIMTTLGALSPLEKVVAMSEYARIVGKAFNPEAGINPLTKDLAELSTKDTTRAAQISQVMPSDIDGLALEIALYLNNHTDPKIDAWINTHLGSSDAFIAQNFGDSDPRTPGIQRGGLEGFRELVSVAGGADKFAVQVGVTAAELTASIRGMVEESRGNALTTMLMDTLGPEGAGVEVYARKVGAAVRDAEIYRLNKGSVTDHHIEQIQTAYAELLARMAGYDKLKGERIETVSNIAMMVALTGTMVVAPSISPSLLFGVGAISKAGTHLAFGERDAMTLLQQSVRGGAAGMLTYFAAAGMAELPTDMNIWLKAVQGGVEQAKYAVGYGATLQATDGKLLQKGVRATATAMVDDLIGNASIGFATGFVVTAATGFLEKALRKEEVVKPPKKEPTPIEQPPVERPQPPPKTQPPVERPQPPPVAQPPVERPGGGVIAPPQPPVVPPVQGQPVPPPISTVPPQPITGRPIAPVAGRPMAPVPAPTPVVTTPAPAALTATTVPPVPVTSVVPTVVEVIPPVITPPPPVVITPPPPVIVTPPPPVIPIGTTPGAVDFVSPVVTGNAHAARVAFANAYSTGASSGTLAMLLATESSSLSASVRRGVQLPHTVVADLERRAVALSIPLPQKTNQARYVGQLLGAIRSGGTQIAQGKAPQSVGATPPPPKNTLSKAQKGQQEWVNTIASHPKFKGASRAWIETRMTPALEVLLGQKAGSLKGVSSGDATDLLWLIDENFPHTKETMPQILGRLEADLSAFGYRAKKGSLDVTQLTSALKSAASGFDPQLLTQPGGTAKAAARLGSWRQSITEMRTAGTLAGKPLPTTSGVTNDRSSDAIKHYQGQIGVPVTGRFDATTKKAHREYLRTQKANATTKKEITGYGEILQRAIPKLTELESGGDVTCVADVVRSLTALQGTTGAPAGKMYQDSLTQVINVVRTGPDGGFPYTRIAVFARELGKSNASASLSDALLTQGIMRGMLPSQRTAIANALHAGNVDITSLPAGTLDMLDDVPSDNRAAFHDAAVSNKEISQVLQDEPGDFLAAIPNKITYVEAGQRLAALRPEDAGVLALVSRLVAMVNDDEHLAVATLLKSIADEGGNRSIAAHLVAAIYNHADTNRWQKDDLALDIAKPRAGKTDKDSGFDSAFGLFVDRKSGAHTLMIEHLESFYTGVFGYFDTGEKAAAAYLRKAQKGG